ncbi:hypothetical protein AB0J72_16945 [Dactylosporangium sp. NPDC049742]|uniref:hypothetical protein n=1 Tax=Dactylosporangium sp. NPDC049742 TaxID=3154737 RepID=UPI003419DBB5
MLPRDPVLIDGARYAEYAQTATTQAAVLRSAAIRAEAAVRAVGRGTAGAAFESPSASRFKQRTGDMTEDLRAAADRLTELAEDLDRMSKHYGDLYLAWKTVQP